MKLGFIDLSCRLDKETIETVNVYFEDLEKLISGRKSRNWRNIEPNVLNFKRIILKIKYNLNQIYFVFIVIPETFQTTLVGCNYIFYVY